MAANGGGGGGGDGNICSGCGDVDDTTHMAVTLA